MGYRATQTINLCQKLIAQIDKFYYKIKPNWPSFCTSKLLFMFMREVGKVRMVCTLDYFIYIYNRMNNKRGKVQDLSEPNNKH